MRDSLNDSRVVELLCEEVLGRLQRLRREQKDANIEPLAHTRELLQLSATLRQMSAQTRIRSQAARAAAIVLSGGGETEQIA